MTDIKKHTVFLFALAGLAMLAGIAQAQETTGENIRVIIEDMHNGMTEMDPQIKRNESEQEQINTRLDGLRDRLLNDTDPESQRLISAEMLEGHVRLNGLARDRIELFTHVIGDVLHPSLLKLGSEVENVGAMGKKNWGEFESYRNDMEAIIPFIAGALLETDRLLAYTTDQEASERLKAESAELRSTLVFFHNSLASASEMGELVAEDIYDQANALGGVYGKLVVLGQLLDQEANVLRGELLTQSWEAIKPFIDGSDMAVAMNSAESMTGALQARTDDIRLIRSTRKSGAAAKTIGASRSDDDLVRRMNRGEMGW